jgi:hypothetical protein
MSQLTDRKKLRQKYLTRKFRAIAHAGLAWGMACAIVIGYLCWLQGCDNARYGVEPVIWVTLYFLVRGRSCAREVSAMRYVPPITPDTLPADEILVRGSEAPTDHSEILLRAAKEQETPKEELVRASEE